MSRGKKPRSILLPAACVLFLIPCETIVAAERRPLPPGTRVGRDITYATVGERKLPLDLYIPDTAEKPLPLVIWIHGGGWRGGSKANPGRALPLLEHGYAVASVEYRLSAKRCFRPP